jgi:hypothetical protein
MQPNGSVAYRAGFVAVPLTEGGMKKDGVSDVNRELANVQSKLAEMMGSGRDHNTLNNSGFARRTFAEANRRTMHVARPCTAEKQVLLNGGMPFNLRINTLGDFATGAQGTPRDSEGEGALAFSPIKQRRGPAPLQPVHNTENPSHKRVLGNIIPADCHNNEFSSKLMYNTETGSLGQGDIPKAMQSSSPKGHGKRTEFTKHLSNDAMSSPILKGNGFSIAQNDMMQQRGTGSGLWTYKGIQGHAPIGSNMTSVNGSTSYSDSSRSVIALQEHREFLSPALSRRTGFYNRFANGTVSVVGNRSYRERSAGVHAPAALCGGADKPIRYNRHGTRAASNYSTPSTTNHMLTPR